MIYEINLLVNNGLKSETSTLGNLTVMKSSESKLSIKFYS